MKNVFFCTIIFLAFVCSCKKSATPSQNAKTPEEILTANPWKISEYRGLQNTTFYYYLRGGSNHDLDNEYITFNSNSTGTYTAPNGTQTAISSWNFIDAGKTKIQYTIMFSTPLVVNWENVQLTSLSIKYSEYHALNGVNSLAVATRIPK